MFLPTTPSELTKLGWKQPDIILISGDTYLDVPSSGIAVIGRILMKAGFKVAIIAQPDLDSSRDLLRLGEPSLFWGISSGAVDSMVANYTALKKRRKTDDFTPGGINDSRPDRALIVYSNLVRQYSKNKKPIVLGGIEASLRRIAHYDYWSDSVRRSIIFDAKADLLVYGLAENTVVSVATALRGNTSLSDLRGVCYISNRAVPEYINLPGYEEAAKDKNKFSEMFRLFYENNDPMTAKGLCQKHGDRYLIQNPPSLYPTQEELDGVYELDFERAVHPFYSNKGIVRALDTVQFSITSHFGCFGECNFCAISVHQGRKIRSRSVDSLLRETEKIVKHPAFKGIISDVGGGSLNMYGMTCDKMEKAGSCKDKRCLYPKVCKNLKNSHLPQLVLFQELKKIKGIRKIFAGSGLRYDLLLEDKVHGMKYLEELVLHHISGQLKVAPEHCVPDVLKIMEKQGVDYLMAFKELFEKINKKYSKKQYLTYYFISSHPGCTLEDAKALQKYFRSVLKFNPEQIQTFTPTPSTFSTLMYYSETNPLTGKKIFVEKTMQGKVKEQKELLKKK